MLEIKRILYPTDFSPLSQAAIGHVLGLAERFDAEIHCLHVVDEAFQYWVGAGETAVPLVAAQDDLRAAAQQHMEQFCRQHFAGAGERLHSEVILGRPFVEIIRYARDREADLIVIATHGHGGLASVLLGSVTEKVVRKAPCPVLTVRHPEHRFEMP